MYLNNTIESVDKKLQQKIEWHRNCSILVCFNIDMGSDMNYSKYE